MFKLIVAALLVAGGIAAYKLWKAGKAVTAGSVAAGVKSEVSDAATAAKPALLDIIKKFFTKK